MIYNPNRRQSCQDGVRQIEYSWFVLIIGLSVWWIWDLSNLWRDLPEYSFGWVVPMLTAILVWERIPNRPMHDKPIRIINGLPLLLISFIAVMTAELYRIGIARTPTSSWLLSMGLAGFLTVGLLFGFGPRVSRHFLFPLLFFFVAVPLPKFVWNPIVISLQAIVTKIDVEVLNLIGIPAMQQGNVIQLPNTLVGVDEACSGIRSLQSSLMAAVFIGDLVLGKTSWKTFLSLLVLLIAVIGNLTRSLFLSLIAYAFGSKAFKQSHDAVGWIVLASTILSIVVAAYVITRIERKSHKEIDSN